MESQKWQQHLGAIAVLAVLGLSWLAAMSHDRGIDVFARSGYWIMLAMLSTWAMAAYAVIPHFTWREIRVPLVTAAAGVAVCFASSPIGFKVLSDETNLLSVSQSMYQSKTALHPTMGKFYYDNFNATFVAPPSRPLVFPFLLSLVHGLTGYHAWNAFVLNALVLFAFLFLICLVTQRICGVLAAIAAVLLVLSHPIVQISAASGGFDLLSVFVLVIALLAVRRHVQLRTPESLALVWMTLLVFAQVRYESIIAIPIVMGFLLLRGYVTLEMLLTKFAYFATGPLFLFPWVLQRSLNRNSFENPPGVPPFSISHLAHHLDELLAVQLDFRFYFPYDNVLNLLAGLLLLALLIGSFRRGFADWSREQCDFVTLSFFVVGSSLGVFLSHHMGKASHPTQARFFIPLSVACAGVPLLVHRLRPQWYSSGALLACSIVLFLVYQPMVGESRIMRTLILTRETQLAMDYLTSFGHRRILTVSDRSGHYAALGVGAVDFPTARVDAASLLSELQQRLFNEIVVFQEIDYARNEPIEEHQLPDSFHLQTVEEYQISAERKLRIARTVLP